MMSNAHAIAPAMYKTLRYDSVADFQMVSMVGTAGLVLVTAPDFPAKDLKGVIAHAKANPGKLNFGSPGVGTTQHFAAEYHEAARRPRHPARSLSLDAGRAHRADRGRGADGDRADPDRAGAGASAARCGPSR